MRIGHYLAQLGSGKPVVIGPYRLEPPSADDPDRGIDLDLEVSSTETVELTRALQAWLTIHRRLHPEWHTTYRRDDPGTARAARESGKQ